MPTKQQRDPMLDLPNKREVYIAMLNFTRSAAFEARVRQIVFKVFEEEHISLGTGVAFDEPTVDVDASVE